MVDGKTMPRLTRRRFLAASAAAGALVGLQYGAGRYLTRLPGAGAAGDGRSLALDPKYSATAAMADDWPAPGLPGG